MKNSNFPLLGLLCTMVTAACFTGCLKDDCNSTRTFVQFNPVYRTLNQIRTDIEMEGPRALNNPGKLYFYNNYILINERQEGIHLIDNSNPAAPQNLAFIAIPGAQDMAVKNNRLYVDNYIDLLTINIEDPTSPQLVTRTENVFNNYTLFQDLGYLVDYEPEQISVEVDCTDPNFGSGWFFRNEAIFIDVAFDAGLVNSVSGSSPGALKNAFGVGGSMARFALYDQYLYAVDESSLRVFDVVDCDDPRHRNTIQVGWGIETIFPYGDNLFLGANNGVHIFDNTNPLEPRRAGLFEHARACDPVYIVNDVAFVTLRDGTECEGFNNQLDLVDVSNINNPNLLQSYPMDNPHGLSIRDNVLYLCEGTHGLKVFDITTIEEIDNNLIDHRKGFEAFDVIAVPNQNVILVIGRDGLYQFDNSDPHNLKEISRIEVIRS